MMGIQERHSVIRQNTESLSEIEKQCVYCQRSLHIPAQIVSAVNSELDRKDRYTRRDKQQNSILDSAHLGFYVSPGGNYYCNSRCFCMFTED